MSNHEFTPINLQLVLVMINLMWWCQVWRNIGPVFEEGYSFFLYEGLVYSPELYKVFCKYCSFFPSNSGINPKIATDGVNYWKSCISKLAKYMTKESHGLAEAKYIGFEFTTKAPWKSWKN